MNVELQPTANQAVLWNAWLARGHESDLRSQRHAKVFAMLLLALLAVDFAFYAYSAR